MRRTSLVTGAAIGIGRATARILAESGDHVLVTDILEEEGRAFVQELLDQGLSAEFHQLDVTSSDDCQAVAEAARTAGGGVDVLVANAGIVGGTTIEGMSDADWDRVVEVDLKGVFRAMRAVVPQMQAKGKGHIVAVSSVMGVLHGWDTKVNYSAAKAGVAGLVKGAAVELGPQGIRVNAVAPGLTRTAQSLGPNAHGPEGVARIARKIPLRRAAEPEDIGNIIAFLASDKSFFITGQTIVADGGFAIGNYR